MLSTIILIGILYYLYKFYSKVRQLPPGPFPLPVIGNMYLIDIKYPHKTLEKWSKIYGPVYTAWIGDANVILGHYSSIKEAFLKQAEIFAGRPRLESFDIIFQGNNGIVMSEGKKWKEQRRFSLHILRDFGFGRPLMETKVLAQAGGLVEIIKEKITDNSAVFNPTGLLELCVGNIISDLLFGHTFDADLDRFEYLMVRLNRFVSLLRRPGALLLNNNPWLKYVPLFDHFSYTPMKRNLDEIFVLFNEEIDAHLKNLYLDAAPDDFLTAYLQEKAKGQKASFSDLQTKIVIANLWIAGFETTVTTLRWGLLYMIVYPKVQAKVQEEIDRVIGPDGTASMAHRNAMPYTAATVTEIQRISFILPLAPPHKCTQDTVLLGHRIPAGTTVLAQFHNVLHDEETFPSPDEFRPERFLEADGKVLNVPEEFIPFGLGKRQCMGESLARMQLFLIFVSLMQQFKFSAPEGAPKPSAEPIFGAALVPKDYKCFVRVRI